LSSPLVALLEALRLELDFLLLPPFFEPAFEVVLRAAFFAALLVFEAAFLPLLLAFDFVDLVAFDDFDLAPALAFDLLLFDLPADFFYAI
jgi:hypothetical protein